MPVGQAHVLYIHTFPVVQLHTTYYAITTIRGQYFKKLGVNADAITHMITYVLNPPLRGNYYMLYYIVTHLSWTRDQCHIRDLPQRTLRCMYLCVQ